MKSFLCYADRRFPIHPNATQHGGRALIVPLNEYDFLKRALVAHSSKEAVICGSIRLTYAQFGERVNRWANAMRKLGVKKGDRVAVLSRNCRAFHNRAQRAFCS